MKGRRIFLPEFAPKKVIGIRSTYSDEEDSKRLISRTPYDIFAALDAKLKESDDNKYNIRNRDVDTCYKLMHIEVTPKKL